MTEKNVEYYLKLPYTIQLHPSPEGGYAVEVVELPGCISQGDTVEEALEMIEDAKKAWIGVALEDQDPIPQPGSGDYSGKFLLRIPKSLHRNLAERAGREGISLNQYVLYQLSRNRDL